MKDFTAKINNVLKNYYGLLAVFTGFIGINISLMIVDNFDWTTDVISRLGIEPKTSAIYNTTLVIGSLFNLLFTYNFLDYLRISKRSIVAFLFGLSIVCVIALGIYPGYIHGFTHKIIAQTYFSTYSTSILIVGLYLLYKNRLFAIYCIIFGFAGLTIPLSLMPFFGRAAVPELAYIIVTSIWVTGASVKMIVDSHLNNLKKEYAKKSERD